MLIDLGYHSSSICGSKRCPTTCWILDVTVITILGDQDSSVSKVTCYKRDWVLISGRVRDFTHCHYIQTGSAANTASYLLGTGDKIAEA
jgi:hypothetical protein